MVEGMQAELELHETGMCKPDCVHCGLDAEYDKPEATIIDDPPGLP